MLYYRCENILVPQVDHQAQVVHLSQAHPCSLTLQGFPVYHRDPASLVAPEILESRVLPADLTHQEHPIAIKSGWNFTEKKERWRVYLASRYPWSTHISWETFRTLLEHKYKIILLFSLNFDLLVSPGDPRDPEFHLHLVFRHVQGPQDHLVPLACLSPPLCHLYHSFPACACTCNKVITIT